MHFVGMGLVRLKSGPRHVRRRVLGGALGLVGLALIGRRVGAEAGAAQGAPRFEFELTDAQWRARLSAMQYAVLRQAATERAFTSPLDEEKRPGTYACAGCSRALFSSATKYDSGSGWPSFWRPLESAVGTTDDSSFGMQRTAVHCQRCGGHLGHVFDDGPPPTGLRYCINGVALVFSPKGEKS